MRGIALVVVVVSSLCAALVYIPASLFIPKDHYLTAQRFAMIEQVSGTLWHGQALLRSRQKETQLLVDWDISVACLMIFRLCADIQVNTSAAKGRPSELYMGLSVPGSSMLLSKACAPFSQLTITQMSGLLSAGFLRMFVPELMTAEQSIGLRNIDLSLDLAKGIVKNASGQVDLEAGTIRFATPNGLLKNQYIEALSGEILASEEYELTLKNQDGKPYVALLTDDDKQRLRFVVYDSFAQVLGAAPAHGITLDVPRFEISQKISDMICESA